jgi:hypothetical protein
MAQRVMAIFSLGGPTLSAHLRSRAVRCRTGFFVVGGDDPPEVVLDPFPTKEPGARGVVSSGVATLFRGDEQVASQPAAPAARRRWDDLDLLAFAATTLWTWIGLPLALDHPGVRVRAREAGVLDVTVPTGWPATGSDHVLHLDGEGHVVRHEERGVVHHLSGHCDFSGVNIATRRRSRSAAGVPLLWADVVAAVVFPQPPQNPSTEGAGMPSITE